LLHIATRKFIGDSTTEKDCAKQNAFQLWRKTFQMVHGAWRDSMTALFQDFVAHETHRLIPGFDQDAAEIS
jgi:hypothetical protein